MNKIVILDSATTSDDIHVWDPLKAYGEVIVYHFSRPEDIPSRIADAWAVLTNKAALHASDFDAAKKLKYVGVLATGYNIIDLDAACKNGVRVCNVPSYSTDAVAQMVFALLLELTNRVGAHAAEVKAGRWEQSELFTFRLCPIPELAGKTLGILGFGHIGSRVAQIAQAFGMHVITTSSRELPADVERVSMEEMMRRSDVLSLNCALTPDRLKIINATTLALMKPTALIINTARGGLIDEAALAEALKEGKIAGAGLDVLTQEPPRDGSPLLQAPNCIITPHIAWQSTEAISRLLKITEQNLKAFAAGKPQNRVS